MPIGVAVAAAGAVAVIAAVDPNEPGNYPTCPWLYLTGTYCPGCGSLRAIHALAHGDPGIAMARNPLAVVALLWLTIWFVVWARRVLAGRQRKALAPARLLYAILGLVMGYWVLRNVPGWTYLSPA